MDLVDRETFLYNFVYVLFRRKVLIVSIFVLLVALFLFAGYLLTPSWESETLIVGEQVSRSSVAPFADAASSAPPPEHGLVAQQLVAILKGKGMAYDMVKQFHLDERLRQRKKAPSENRDRIKTAIVKTVTFPITLIARPSGQPPAERDWVDLAASRFRSGSSAWINVRVVEGTDVVRLAVDGETPQLAVDVGRAMVQRLSETVARLAAKANGEARDAYRKEMVEVNAKLKEAEEALRGFRESTLGVEIPDAVRLKTARLNDLIAAGDKARSEKGVLEAQRQTLHAATNAADLVMLSSPAIDQNEIVRNLKSKLHDRMAARAVLLVERTEAHPEVRSLETEIAQVKNSLDKEIDNVLKSLEADMLSTEQEVRNLEAELVRLPAKQLTLTRLTLQVQGYQQIYQSLQSRAEELNAMGQSGLGDVTIKVLDAPIVSPQANPDYPRWLLILLVAIPFSGFMALFVPFFIEYWRDPIKGPLDLRLKGMAVIGVVPELKREGPVAKT